MSSLSYGEKLINGIGCNVVVNLPIRGVLYFASMYFGYDAWEAMTIEVLSYFLAPYLYLCYVCDTFSIGGFIKPYLKMLALTLATMAVGFSAAFLSADEFIGLASMFVFGLFVSTPVMYGISRKHRSTIMPE